MIKRARITLNASKRRSIKKGLSQWVVLLVGVFVINLEAVSGEADAQVTKAKSSHMTAGQNDGIAIPPEVMQQIQNHAADAFARGQKPLGALTAAERIFFGLAAGGVFVGAVMICRLLQKNGSVEKYGQWYVGLAGMGAALLGACSAVGNLYLHIAAIICTGGAGFIIAFLLAGIQKQISASPNSHEKSVLGS